MTKNIVILNTFCFLKIKMDRADLEIQLLSRANALEDSFIKEQLEEVLELYDSYQNFMLQLKNDASVLKRELNSNRTGSLLFSQTYGFAELKFVYSNKTINIFTPFGEYNKTTKIFGYSAKYIGSNAVFF